MFLVFLIVMQYNIIASFHCFIIIYCLIIGFEIGPVYQINLPLCAVRSCDNPPAHYQGATAVETMNTFFLNPVLDPQTNLQYFSRSMSFFNQRSIFLR